MLSIYKNRLQQYTQKEHIGLPVYINAVEGPPHDPQFKSTVIVNDKSYMTSESFPTRKEAEQAAAQVACQALFVDAIQATTDESLYKNLLQQYAQKRGFMCPTYRTVASGLPHKRVFVSTVEIEKHTFQGAEAKTKKLAEMYAAKVAYLTLSNATKSSEVSCMDIAVADALSQNIQPTATTKKHKDTSCEDPYLHAKRMKPSTEFMVVITPPLSNSPSIVSEGEKSVSVLPQVDNSSHVPARPVTDQTVENEPLLLVNTLPPSNFPSENNEVQNSFPALPPVDNSSHVPAHPVTDQTVENEPLHLVNTLPPSNFPSENNEVQNSVPALPPVDNSSHVPPARPVIEQTVEIEPMLPPNDFPCIDSHVANSQVENSLPTPVDPVTEQTIQDKPLLERTLDCA